MWNAPFNKYNIANAIKSLAKVAFFLFQNQCGMHFQKFYKIQKDFSKNKEHQFILVIKKTFFEALVATTRRVVSVK